MIDATYNKDGALLRQLVEVVEQHSPDARVEVGQSAVGDGIDYTPLGGCAQQAGREGVMLLVQL